MSRGRVGIGRYRPVSVRWFGPFWRDVSRSVAADRAAGAARRSPHGGVSNMPRAAMACEDGENGRYELRAYRRPPRGAAAPAALRHARAAPGAADPRRADARASPRAARSPAGERARRGACRAGRSCPAGHGRTRHRRHRLRPRRRRGSRVGALGRCGGIGGTRQSRAGRHHPALRRGRGHPAHPDRARRGDRVGGRQHRADERRARTRVDEVVVRRLLRPTRPGHRAPDDA